MSRACFEGQSGGQSTLSISQTLERSWGPHDFTGVHSQEPKLNMTHDIILHRLTRTLQNALEEGNGMHFVHTRGFVLPLIGLIYRVTLDKLVKGFLDLYRVDQALSKHSVKRANFLTISHSRPLTGRRASLQPTTDLISVSLV